MVGRLGVRGGGLDISTVVECIALLLSKTECASEKIINMSPMINGGLCPIINLL